jgi:hypothetical protein
MISDMSHPSMEGCGNLMLALLLRDCFGALPLAITVWLVPGKDERMVSLRAEATASVVTRKPIPISILKMPLFYHFCILLQFYNR